MAMHFAGTPISFMANVHCAAATENFLALEHHSLDVPWWKTSSSGDQPLSTRASPPSPTGPASASSRTPTCQGAPQAEPGYFEPTRVGQGTELGPALELTDGAHAPSLLGCLAPDRPIHRPGRRLADTSSLIVSRHRGAARDGIDLLWPFNPEAA